MKRVLFVDDEANVLKGLERMLRSVRHEWDLHFVNSAKDALALLKEDGGFDVIVTDIRMPSMDGIAFLNSVREQSPHSVRFVLSGNTDARTVMRASGIAHQYLNKPCDPHVLQVQIARALALREHLRDGPLKDVLHEIGSLPSMPALYQEVVAEINSDDPTVARVAEIIEQDPAMSAKVLQIVNSAFVGLSHRVTGVPHAVSLLGLENVRNLVLLAGVFFSFEGKVKTRHVSLEALWNHSLEVARCAMTIAREEAGESEAVVAAFTAGLLHDVGLLVLSARLPEQLDAAFAWARENKQSLFDGEREVLGATHAQVGGYLLELWGLPDPVTEAVAYHDYPSACPESVYETTDTLTFAPLTAVHVANYFRESRPDTETMLDEVYLMRLGLDRRVGEWWDLCENQ